MALVKCEECGHDVSTKAETCPHCGAPQGDQTAQPTEPAGPEKKGGGCGLLIFVVLAGTVFITFLSQQGSNTPDVPRASSTQATTQAAQTKEQNTAVSFGNKGHDMLLNMSDDERTKALDRYLKESNKSCTATSSFFQGVDEDNAAYWNVACSNGEGYNIQIAADSEGSTRILECGIMKLIGVECFKKFD